MTVFISLRILGLFASALAAALSAIGVAEARTIRDHRGESVGGSAHVVRVTPVVELVLDYAPGRTISCRTSNLSAGADPVVHLLAMRGGPVAELARGDDKGLDLNAEVSIVAPPEGKVRLVLRAAGRSQTGTADLACDGYRVWAGLPVGGGFQRISGYRSSEYLQTVPLPGGPMGHLYYLLDDDGRMLRRHTSNFGGSIVDSSQDSASFTVMLGSSPGTIAVVREEPPTIAPGIRGRAGAVARPGDIAGATAGPAPATAGPLGGRIVRPDLAPQAELIRLPDPPGDVRLVRNDLYLAGHDPDGDGLGAELEAHIGACSRRTDVVVNFECSRAADPRDTDGDGISDRLELLGRPEKPPALLLPRWGADPRHKDIFLEVDFRKRSANEAPRKLSREMALAMAAIYADPETDALFRLAHAQSLSNPDLKAGISLHLDTGVQPPANSPLSELTTYGDWGGYSVAEAICDANGCRGMAPHEAMPTLMHASRKGVFHYALGEPESGGQAPTHSIALNLPILSSVGAAHEFGHTLGLNHGGPTDIGPDANCKPNYPSIMSYAYSGKPGFVQSFSDGYGRSALNNAALTERGAVQQPNSGPGRAYLAHLRDIFGYGVNTATGDVDWTRDGVISDGTVSAYANNDHSNCEFTRVNQMNGQGLSDGAITLTRLGGRTLLLYADERDRAIHVEFTDNTLACPTIGAGCGPTLQHRAVGEPWNSGILALDAHPVGSGAGARLVVVFRTANGLFESTMTRNFAWTAPVAIAVSSAATGDPSLAGDSAETVLAFRDANGAVVLKRRTSAGLWGPDEPAVGATGQPIAGLAPDSSPGILKATYTDGRSMLIGAFPSGLSGLLYLYELDSATGRWRPAPWSNAPRSSTGRPALAMEPAAPGSPMPGRLRVMHLGRDGAGNNIVRMKTLEAVGLGAGAVLKMADEIHDNVWFYGKGVDLLYEPGIDSNLRAAIASTLVPSGGPSPHTIALRPKADGVVHFLYRNWNDWEALGIGLCRVLAKAGADVACPAWPYSALSQPPPPAQPPPPPAAPSARQQCLADCEELYQACRADNLAALCVPQRALCRAGCP